MSLPRSKMHWSLSIFVLSLRAAILSLNQEMDHLKMTPTTTNHNEREREREGGRERERVRGGGQANKVQ